MLRAIRIMQARECAAPAADVLRLDHDRRHRRRIVLITESGRSLLLDLPQAAHLHDGDGLVTETGEIILVRAALESLIEIRAPDTQTLLRIAWHLGNRHLPVQVAADWLRIRADHVVIEMVRALGGRTQAIEAPFDPEAGAYAKEHRHDDPGSGHGQ